MPLLAPGAVASLIFILLFWSMLHPDDMSRFSVIVNFIGERAISRLNVMEPDTPRLLLTTRDEILLFLMGYLQMRLLDYGSLLWPLLTPII